MILAADRERPLGRQRLGQGDPADGGEAEGEYLEWVIFTAARNLSTEQQGEINAIFRDALATLKIRIVPGSDTL